MDVLVVGGLNNVRYETTAKIMEGVKEFAATVLAQSPEHHPDTPSTFSFATLFLPPQEVPGRRGSFEQSLPEQTRHDDGF